MISFVMKLLEGQSSLNDWLGPFGPKMSEQSLCVMIYGSIVHLIYGQTPDGTIAEFTPKECVLWMCDANRQIYTTWQMVEDRKGMDELLKEAAVIQDDTPDKEVAFDIICRLIETVNQPRRKERLTSDDLDKGLVDLGRRPPDYKWVVNYVTGGFTFRSKAESGSTAKLEDYIRSVMLNKPLLGGLENLEDPTKIVNAN